MFFETSSLKHLVACSKKKHLKHMGINEKIIPLLFFAEISFCRYMFFLSDNRNVVICFCSEAVQMLCFPVPVCLVHGIVYVHVHVWLSTCLQGSCVPDMWGPDPAVTNHTVGGLPESKEIKCTFVSQQELAREFSSKYKEMRTFISHIRLVTLIETQCGTGRSDIRHCSDACWL